MNFATLAPRYAELWHKAVISGPMGRVARVYASRMIAHADTYRKIERICGVPWYVVGVIHAMECGQDFSAHLHNGDPLAAPTTHVPKNRPRATGGPFTFEESAVDALRLDGLHKVRDWTLERLLYQLECFNGVGYLNDHPECKTPYLWSGTQHYTRGKYTSDKHFDPEFVSKQPGAVAILKAAIEQGAEICEPVHPPVVVEPINFVEPIRSDSFVKAPADNPPPTTMAASTEGNMAVVGAGGGVVTTGQAVGAAASAANTPGGFNWAEFVIQLMASPLFWAGLTAIGTALGIWYRRYKRMQQGR